MGRDLGFLILGVAIGLIAANLAKQIAETQKDDRPEAIQDQISNRLDLLERQFSS